MFTNKPLQLWFFSVYCLLRKMQRAHRFLTAIFEYVWCSGHEPILFYISRTALVDHMHKTMTVVAAKAELCISLQLLPCIQTYFETTLKHLHLQCCGMYLSVVLLSLKVCVYAMNKKFEFFFLMRQDSLTPVGWKSIGIITESRQNGQQCEKNKK